MLLCFTPPANAQQGDSASYSWSALLSLDAGAFRNCGGPQFGSYKIDVKGYALQATPEGNANYQLKSGDMNLKPLKPDGSGRLSSTGPNGKTLHWDFEPGVGARKIRVRRDDSECAYLL